MTQENSFDTQFGKCLETLGISLLSEWDLLVFLRRHQTVSSPWKKFPAFWDTERNVVGQAVEEMERAGLVRRSRPSQGVRIYRLVTSVDAPRQGYFELLLALIDKPVERAQVVRSFAPAHATGKRLRRAGLYLK